MLSPDQDTLILGAGMTGLAAGVASGFPVVEAGAAAGGICSSYYVRPGDAERLDHPPADGGAYHFEQGGGHWIFGGDPVVSEFLRSFVTVAAYERESGIYFPATRARVPYPIQNHLAALPRDAAGRALKEILASDGRPCRTAEEWYRDRFGKTLFDLFFAPFNEAYTAGLWRKVAPQDGYKSPLDRKEVERGFRGESRPVGYNATFLYPAEGLDGLVRGLAARSDLHTGRRVTAIDPRGRTLRFADGAEARWKRLISTLPLNVMMEITGLAPGAPRPDPHTSVLVLNIGAVRGGRLPADHWLYVPGSDSGFHRVGVYSNVDARFLPAAARARRDRASLYIERAFLGGARPAPEEIRRIADATVRELQAWEFIGDVEVVDPTWIEVAYTWSWPGSAWRQGAIQALRAHGIHQVGRYGRWTFQGIAESIREGLLIGAACRAGRRG